MDFRLNLRALLRASVLLLSSYYATVASAAILIETGSGSSQSFYQAPGVVSYPIYNIGLYEATSNHGWKYVNGQLVHYRERGTATIYIQEQAAPFGLALNSYEPVDWILTGPGVAKVAKILLYGYHHHTVTGQPANSIVLEMTYENKLDAGYLYASGGYTWPHSASGDIQKIFGYPVSSFAGSYRATSFVIERTAPVVPPLTGQISLEQELNDDGCIEASGPEGAQASMTATASLEGVGMEWLASNGATATGNSFTSSVGLDQIQEITLTITAVDGRKLVLSKAVCVSDTTAPVIEILSPLPGQVYRGYDAELKVRVVDAVDQYITGYTAEVGDTFTATLRDGYSRVKLFKPADRDGSIPTTVTVYSTDSAGNTGVASVEIYRKHDNGK